MAKKYLTLVVSYDDEMPANCKLTPAGISRFVNYLSDAVVSYNNNYPLSQNQKTLFYPRVDMFGFYIDDADMSIEGQNKLNDKC